MLDIFILIGMCVFVANSAKKKGYAGWPFVLMMIFTWLFFGFGAAIAGVIIMGDGNDKLPMGFIIGYIIGAVTACLVTSLLVAVLPARETEDDEDYYADRRRRRSRRDDYDEEDDRDRDGRRNRDRDDRDDRDDRRKRDDRDDDLDDRNWRPRRYSDDR